MAKKKTDVKALLLRAWKFLWEDDSLLSWIANIVIAFILIKFIIFPGLGFLLGTTYPVVAVVSGSMEHEGRFDEWWPGMETRYQAFNISRAEFERFPLKDGFNKGDIIILRGTGKDDLEVGDVVVFRAQDSRQRPDPIIHRAIIVSDDNIQTKGDHNLLQIKSPALDETDVRWSQVLGKAWIRIPWLGYIKIAFVDAISLMRNAVAGG